MPLHNSRIKFLWLLSVILIPTSTEALHSWCLQPAELGYHTRVRYQQPLSTRLYDAEVPPSSFLNCDETQSIIKDLPVFPLRKTVKFPGDTLVLNLYEERYLQLASMVLRREDRLFGALYCSHKPHIVKSTERQMGNQDRKSPVVPLLESGDIGVVCRVLKDSEDMIPTGETNYLRRRIRLSCVVIGRFEIDQVLRDGYSESQPFIVVTGRRFDDIMCKESDHSTKRKLEDQLLPLLASRRDEWSINDQLDFYTQEVEAEEACRTEADLFWSHNRQRDAAVEHLRFQFFSFLVASVAMKKSEQLKRLDVLRSRSTLERLEFAMKKINERNRSLLRKV